MSHLLPLIRLSRTGALFLLILTTAAALLFAHAAETVHESASTSSSAVTADSEASSSVPSALATAHPGTTSDTGFWNTVGACMILALLCLTALLFARVLFSHRRSAELAAPNAPPRLAFSALPVWIDPATPLALGISRV